MKKILIIRFSSIGDIILTTPVLRCLKTQSPETEIHYLTKKSFKSILDHNPYLSKIHTIEKDVKEITAELKKENFDEIIDLHNNLRTLQTKLLLGKKASTFRKLNFQKWLLVQFKINRMPQLHVVDRYMETIKHLGIKNDERGLDYFIPAKDEVALQTLPLTHQQGYIGFVIGAKHFTKQLPLEKIISVCKKINQPLVLLGGKEDRDRGELIVAAIGIHVYNACGIYNLNQSASLVKQAARIISHDTGLMHIAAALKKDITSIWGNTVPAFGFTPYKPGKASKIVEVQGLACRPCSKIGYDKCPKGHFKCMKEINEEAAAHLTPSPSR
ncbi:MAG TPA: glycosyltransferase family 9 protein [Bacteroidia bacterium]|jgi:ADP-heptose:LPS heptosyltransferase|nr:glycosyltransferase family 9 protein [Bacteroidia bacterium]